jgi:filamin
VNQTHETEILSQAAPVNSLQQFRIITQDVKAADLSVTITSPSGTRLKAHIVRVEDGFLVNFTPTQIGSYLLFVTYCGTALRTEPYVVTCLKESDITRVIAFGPGLHSGIINEPAEFVIDTRHSGNGALGVTVEGPCECHLNCRDNGDGTCNISYWPTECGDYTVNITFNNQHIIGSPFNDITIYPTPNIERVKVTGAGIELHGKFDDQSHFFV